MNFCRLVFARCFQCKSAGNVTANGAHSTAPTSPKNLSRTLARYIEHITAEKQTKRREKFWDQYSAVWFEERHLHSQPSTEAFAGFMMIGYEQRRFIEYKNFIIMTILSSLGSICVTIGSFKFSPHAKYVTQPKKTNMAIKVKKVYVSMRLKC